MISRKTMDIITILFVILIIASFFFTNYMFKKSFEDKSAFSENPQDTINDFAITLQLGFLPIQILGLIYYIFVLILAIQLHLKEKLSLINTVFVGIFIPFAFIFYLVSLRKPLKQYEMENKSQI
jgi:uncharacterized membrane protein